MSTKAKDPKNKIDPDKPHRIPFLIDPDASDKEFDDLVAELKRKYAEYQRKLAEAKKED